MFEIHKQLAALDLLDAMVLLPRASVSSHLLSILHIMGSLYKKKKVGYFLGLHDI